MIHSGNIQALWTDRLQMPETVDEETCPSEFLSNKGPDVAHMGHVDIQGLVTGI